MKALSLWQPWASAMALGAKRYETRSWPTKHRGDLAICAARKQPTLEELGGDQKLYEATWGVPYGAILCVVDVYECVESRLFIKGADKALLPLCVLSEQEAEFGDYTPGRWVWMTRNLRPLKKHIPVIGRQGIFNLPADVEAKVRAQL